MNKEDLNNFQQTMDNLCQLYGRQLLRENELDMYFQTLWEYPFNQIKAAVNAHLRDTSEGQFFPKPANLIRHLEGKTPTTDEIIVMAQLKNTPAGVMCGTQISSFDLRAGNPVCLKQGAEACLRLWRQWQNKSRDGSFEAREIDLMLKHGVDPTGSFDGLQIPPTFNHELATLIENRKKLLEEKK